MNKKNIEIDEQLINQLSNLYSSPEYAINSCINIWTHLKFHQREYIKYSLTKNKCMYIIEYFSRLGINYSSEFYALEEIDELMICGICYDFEEELDKKWGCRITDAYSSFSSLNSVCKNIIIEWIILYQKYNLSERKNFEKYIEKLIPKN